MSQLLLEVKDLNAQFSVGKQTVTALDGISFDIQKNQTVGIVGESGSGKSVTALSIMGLLASNGKITQGQINYNGQNLVGLNQMYYRQIRGKEIGLIFQNPMAALNPVFTIGNQMIETIRLHTQKSKAEAQDYAISLLTAVGIPDPQTRLTQYPHQFSLGMCQRVMIALTLSMSPKLLIADEPTASLDVTIQAQILTLLAQLKKDTGMSMLIISHDLGVMAQHCDHILVMYLGKIVESGTPEDIFKRPKHPYTQALISSIPSTDPTKKHAPTLLKGDIPSPLHLPTGCRFHTRCPKAQPNCATTEPQLQQIESQKFACFYATLLPL